MSALGTSLRCLLADGSWGEGLGIRSPQHGCHRLKLLGVLAGMDQIGSYSRQWHVLGWYCWLLYNGFVLRFCGSCFTCLDLPEKNSVVFRLPRGDASVFIRTAHTGSIVTSVCFRACWTTTISLSVFAAEMVSQMSWQRMFRVSSLMVAVLRDFAWLLPCTTSSW